MTKKVYLVVVEDWGKDAKQYSHTIAVFDSEEKALVKKKEFDARYKTHHYVDEYNLE